MPITSTRVLRANSKKGLYFRIVYKCWYCMPLALNKIINDKKDIFLLRDARMGQWGPRCICIQYRHIF